VPQVHPLIEGIELICDRHRSLPNRSGVFECLYEQIRRNWMRYREPDRWPTPDKNWVSRVAPDYTQDPYHRLEKQLQKQIAICLEREGWGNDLPTASGLVNSRGRQMNVDLVHKIQGGFELIELKVESDRPYDAALQILRYGAVYMLYRLEPDLAKRFKGHSLMCAKRIVLEVLAPHRYYLNSDIDLQDLEVQLNQEVMGFVHRRAIGLELTFRFMTFPADFMYEPGMECNSIHNAVRQRRRLHDTVEIKGYAGYPIRSFCDWDQHALPPERRKVQWKEGRSEFELAREWMSNRGPMVPVELARLLDANEGTSGVVISDGITQHETILPFSNRGARCHDLMLRAAQDGHAVTICVEAKADESFGCTVREELLKARSRPVTRFPERLDWLTRCLLGVPAFLDAEYGQLSNTISELSYQLLTAVAGTLLEAQLQNAEVAIFLVHEFRTTATLDVKLEANEKALRKFLYLFGAANPGLHQGSHVGTDYILGPISIIDRSRNGDTRLPSHIPLFIGKLRTNRVR
jgi:hypothetical protein